MATYNKYTLTYMKRRKQGRKDGQTPNARRQMPKAQRPKPEAIKVAKGKVWISLCCFSPVLNTVLPFPFLPFREGVFSSNVSVDPCDGFTLATVCFVRNRRKKGKKKGQTCS